MKYLMGYPHHTAEHIKEDHLEYVLAEVDKYGLGSVRKWEDFMEFSEITINATNGDLECPKRLDWCHDKINV